MSENIHTWLPTDLPQGIVRILTRQSKLLLVRQIEIVDAADERGNALAVEGFGEGHDEGGFTDALEAIEADDEGTRGFRVRIGAGVGLLV